MIKSEPRMPYPRARILLTLLLLAPAIAVHAMPPEGEEPVASEYILGVEDVLAISVWKEPDLTLSVTIRPDGMITVPLVGDIQAAGRSARHLAQRLGEKLGVYIKEPLVTVIVQEINNFQVYVLGEVGAQGVLTLKRRTRLLQGLAIAGGLTEFADKSNILLIREEDGRETRTRIDYKKIVNGQNPGQNLYLKPGDTILVQ